MAIYVVRAGESVDSIAAKSGLGELGVSEIIYINQLEYPYKLAVGQALWLPDSAENAGRPLFGRAAFTNGYAYPFIEEGILEESLLYLSALSIFSYGFSENGDLVSPPLDDERLIMAARAAQTRPILTLTPFGADGMFNNYLISRLVNSESAKKNMFAQLGETMQYKGYLGIDVDFEYILAEDKDAFTRFVQELAVYMHSLGYTLSIALAPKTSAEQTGILHEGQDYAALGAAADNTLLMTYEWGYTYSEPMPIAPLNWVRRVLDYSVTVIPPSKLDLGIPNYAYDWTLPYVKGESKARTFGVVEAMRQAAEYGAEIFFDETAQSPYYNYVADGVEHEVWFEDVRSLRAKLALIDEYGLHGGGWWQVMRLFRAGWYLLATYFDIEKSQNL